MSTRPFLALLALLLVATGLTMPQLEAAPAKTEKLVVGAGCFWCTEAMFERQPGVVAVVSGYAGGEVKNPTYKQVCTGSTGHAEVIQIEFDPAKTSIGKLLEFFWKTHDVTDGSGVWPDFGNQYRSIILYANDDQKAAVEQSKAEAQKHFSKPIATEISKLDLFYPAEEYHQDYVKRNPNDSYVQRIAYPKLKKLGLLDK